MEAVRVNYFGRADYSLKAVGPSQIMWAQDRDNLGPLQLEAANYNHDTSHLNRDVFSRKGGSQ